MNVTMTISIDDYNNILTALYKERDRAHLENNERNLAFIQRTIDIVKNNTGVAKDAMEVKG